MTPSAPRFGVLAYGTSRRLHREAATALLTLRAHVPGGSDLIVFTDAPQFYRWLAGAVTIETLSPTILRQWRGTADDRFRPKIETLRRLHDRSNHAILVDTDTMATAALAPLVQHLQDGGFVLYEREYRIATPPRKGDRALAHEIAGRTWSGIPADESTWMWNGGIIGVSGAHADVMDVTLAAFDEMRIASRHFALEQLAYSIVFPAYGPVRHARDWFIHYWANRAWFDRRIDRFLSEALLEGLTAEAAATRLREQPIEGKLDGRLPAWQRRLRRLLKIETADDADRDQ